MTTKQRCGFCYDGEHGRHGEIKREWSPEWLMYIPVCRKHNLAQGMDGSGDTIETHHDLPPTRLIEI